MANIRTCNKHNMIACVEKTAQNADFYQIIDFLTGCSINYSLLVDPDLIGPWLQQFWATASLKVINDVPHIRAKVAGKKILISEATIRADLLFDDENGVDCFPKQSKSTSWNNWDKHASALVGCQIVFEQAVRGVDRLRTAIQYVSLPSKSSTSPHSRGCKFLQGLLKALQLKDADPFSNVLLQYKVLLPLWTATPHDYDAVQILIPVQVNQNIKKQKEKERKCAVTLIWKEKVMRLKKVNIKVKEASNVKVEKKKNWIRETHIAEVLVAISRPRGLSIPGPIQSQSPPQQPSQATDPKDKGKGILRKKGDVEGKRSKKTLKERKATIAEE
ncbi:hypothetical protein Tco_1419291 [Tanacetum coccineum]